MTTGSDGAGAAIARAHEWFEHHSGWAPPDAGTLQEWEADGFGRAPDECPTTPHGWCEHGLASWQLILEALAGEADHAGEPRRGAGGRGAAPH